jgi:hypothetical protein
MSRKSGKQGLINRSMTDGNFSLNHRKRHVHKRLYPMTESI